MGKDGGGSGADGVLDRLQASLLSFRDAKIVVSIEQTAVDAVGGGLIFLGGVSLTQLIMAVGRVSASTPLIPSLVGGVGVTTSSILVGAFCLRETDPSPVQMTAAAATGLLLFRLLGGRFRALAPSDFRHPGAFGHAKISLPATLEYADGNARAVIQSFGRLYGCHTCGIRSAAAKFHADHQPPVMVAKAENERFWAKYITGPIVQRYYPQCGGCSNIQGAQVKKNAKKLKLHLTSVRPYHATGFWMVLFGAGGLGGYMATTGRADDSKYASSSSAQDGPVSLVEQVAHEASEVLQSPVPPAVALARLRATEVRLKQERRDAASIPRQIAIDDELMRIRQKKALVKAKAKAQPAKR
ncbi:Aste57867_10104 [Aphanomyces stellatus]|uniref:Aste57867_10104 protein n=1 Tax=Aphanomyces stellatus TaxID=120398 RepID=A0A485KPI5_9STRA|nr:hypothetical protein As57867_010065 [Aphanomyces stellatus]VFT86980.1 Aste57867_10104 [Aphanomyces stellatus]